MIRPDYAAAENAAHAILQNFRIGVLPVTLDIIWKSFKNLKVRTYSWFAKHHNIDISEVVSYADSESGCCWFMVEQNKYMILYNDTISNHGHIRWTIAHELGHYILRHNEKSNKTVISNNSLTKTEYDRFEKEANCFARTLLAPPNVLAALDVHDANNISSLCDISFQAAKNVVNFFNSGMRFGRKYLPKGKIVDLFNNFIFEHRNIKKCVKCTHIFVAFNSIYCPICGNQQFIRGKGEYEVIYEGFEVDENGYPKKCPRCKNEEIDQSGEYCKICGTAILNRCTNAQFDRDGEIIWECKTINAGNARHCIKCGERTSYFKDKLLIPWEEEYKFSQEYADEQWPF